MLRTFVNVVCLLVGNMIAAAENSVPRPLNPPQLEAFPLGQVALERDSRGRDTPFIKNRDKFLNALARTNPDAFLYNFRDAFGQSQPDGAVQLGGWDDQTTRLRGHASGHYLSAIAQAWAGTAYEPELQALFQKKLSYMIDTLYDLAARSGSPQQPGGPCTADPLLVPPGPGKTDYDSDLSSAGMRHDCWNWGRGFLSAYPPDQFIMLEKGAGYGAHNHQVWAPYYTLHKILAGLLDCHELAGSAKALELAENMAAWVQRRLAALTPAVRDGMWKRYIAGEFGGINETLARLYRLTGKHKYLETAKLFDNTPFFFGDETHGGGLAANIDTLGGKHANQHIPQITGALEIYKAGDSEDYLRLARNFWSICTGGYSYSIGGVAGARNPDNPECFTARADSLFRDGFNPGGQNETCATYNLLKLSRQLFFYDPQGLYMDYYERGLYNHILASVAEHDPGNTYHVPLNPGAKKQFDNAKMDGFSCCNGTALENNTKFQDSIYFKSRDNRTLYLNLFIPSRLDWPERNISLRLLTEFPYGDVIQLLVGGCGEFDLKVRVPAWAQNGFIVKLNGRELAVRAEPGHYLSLSRQWQDGDRIEIRIPFSFWLMPLKDQPNIASVFYGPVLLAATEEQALPTWRSLHLDQGDIGRSIRGEPSQLRFTVDGVGLKPFFEVYDRHSVYFDIVRKGRK